jgi:hypothetical protein
MVDYSWTKFFAGRRPVDWFVVVLELLAFPCFVIGLLALPLCGAAPTFFAAAKKVGKEDSFKPLILKRVPLSV